MSTSSFRTKVSVGSNPWAKKPVNYNLASICERYGGGGHPAWAPSASRSARLGGAAGGARDRGGIAELRGGAEGELKRRDFQELARIRLKEARLLLRAGCWEGAYYLGGYAVECLLKAFIARKTERHDFPDKERTNQSYTHDLEKLCISQGSAARLRKRDASILSWSPTGKSWENGRRRAAMKSVPRRKQKRCWPQFNVANRVYTHG